MTFNEEVKAQAEGKVLCSCGNRDWMQFLYVGTGTEIMAACKRCDATFAIEHGVWMKKSEGLKDVGESKAEWRVISPDGIPICPETFPSQDAAHQALTEWCKRYAAQGYYAAVDGRIALAELPAACEIEMVDRYEED